MKKFIIIICIISLIAIGCAVGYFGGNAFFPPKDDKTISVVEELKLEFIDLQSKLEVHVNDAEKEHAKIVVIDTELTEVKNQLERLDDTDITQQNQIELLIQKQNQLIADRNETQAKYEEIQQTVNELNSQITVLQNKIATLENGISNMSNPNLLINGDFRINQRGETMYSGNRIYSVDRWQIRDADLTVNSDYTLTIQNKNAQYAGITQYYEFPNELLGRTVTFSVKIKEINTSNYVYLSVGDCTNSLYMGNILAEKVGLVVGVNVLTLTLPQTLQNTYLNFAINNDAGDVNSTDNFTIEWAKLEYGSMATEFRANTYAYELAKCQRYYYRIAPNQAYGVFGSTFLRIYNEEYGLTAFTVINLPVTMRKTPTFSMNGNFRNNSVEIGGVGRHMVWQGSTNTIFEVAFSVNKGVAGHGGTLEANNDASAYMEFDAEI